MICKYREMCWAYSTGCIDEEVEFCRMYLNRLAMERKVADKLLDEEMEIARTVEWNTGDLGLVGVIGVKK